METKSNKEWKTNRKTNVTCFKTFFCSTDRQKRHKKDKLVGKGKKPTRNKKNTTNSDCEENKYFSSPKYILRRYGIIIM